MIVAGLEKFTLLDYPGKIACTIFLYGCNFRCGFCHNPELVIDKNPDSFSEDYILEFLNKRKNQLEAVCFTGGEPLLTLKKDFVKKVKQMGYLVKIDTNGSNPNALKELIDERLVDYIAMDIKSSKEKYETIIHSKINIELIEKSITLIAHSNVPYEFRTTILKRFHDIDEIKKIGVELNELFGKKPEKYTLQGFSNQGKTLDNAFKNEANTEENYLLELKRTAINHFNIVELRI
jgi:pyruvate formate lyase activating enzyme